MIRIVVANQRGGSAKSTTTATLARCFADRGKRVLVIDADPQGSLAVILGLDPPAFLNDLLIEKLAVLWIRAKPETTDTRVITAGWRTMKRLCGMSDKSCKRNTTGLIEKFALEVVSAEDISTRTGRTYRIHSYVSILARRKAAGLEWFLGTDAGGLSRRMARL